MRIVAVRKGLVAVLIHRGVIKAMPVGEIRVQHQPVIRTDVVGNERGVVVGLGQARPIKKVRKLSRRICRRRRRRTRTQ